MTDVPSIEMSEEPQEQSMECEPSVAEIVAEDQELQAEPNAEASAVEKESNEPSGEHDPCRVHVSNLPKYFGCKDFKKLLNRYLPKLNSKRVRQLRDCAYLTLDTPEEAQSAIKIFNGVTVKKCALHAKLAVKEERKVMSTADIAKEQENGEIKIRTAKECVEPLSDVPYDEQLMRKNNNSIKIMKNLINQFSGARCDKIKESILKPIISSPKILEYRNKCEFTIGLSIDLKPCIGFKGGKYLKQQNYVVPVADVSILTRQTKKIVKEFENFVIESGIEPFDEVSRKGFWKLLTVREFGLDVMLIVTVHPLDDAEKEAAIKKEIAKRYLDLNTIGNFGFRITSLYWCDQVHASDNINFEHIGGTPYIYENMLDCRFRISPSAFFQTNSVAASVLYKVIGEACGFTDTEPCKAETLTVKREQGVHTVGEGEENGQAPMAVSETDEPVAKRSRLEEVPQDSQLASDANGAGVVKTVAPSSVLLDICCGTGTIGLFIMKNHRLQHNMFLLGFEYVESAVKDAVQNAQDNGLPDDCYRFVSGPAEDRFSGLRFLVPSTVDLEKSNVVGVLDPPRAGIHNRVICRLRELNKLRKLVYVSCDPSSAIKNIVDLCRPTSKKFGGEPFTVACIQPVDMFPQTAHFEWVITLCR